MLNPQNIFTNLAELPGGIKRRQLNYSELWDAFKQQQLQAATFAAEHNIYDPAQYQPIPEQKVNQYWESDLIKQERL